MFKEPTCDWKARGGREKDYAILITALMPQDYFLFQSILWDLLLHILGNADPREKNHIAWLTEPSRNVLWPQLSSEHLPC